MEPVLSLDIINKEEEYEIKEVRKYQKQGQRTQFLVHWKGYGDEYDQWIAKMGLPHAKEMIKDYWQKISSQKHIKEEDKTPN